MATTTHRPQSIENHRSWPPLWFLAAGVVLLVEIGRATWLAVREPEFWNLWAVLLWVAVFLVWAASRGRAQLVQDRLIRLEMTLRLERLLGASRRAEVARLALPQLVALRFASDAELPALVDEVLAGSLATPREIKRRVKDWQADWLRV